MKSYEQIARLLYETYEKKKYVFAHTIIAWHGLSDRAQQSWIAAAKAAVKEITEVY